MFEETSGVEFGGVAYVAAFGVGYDELVGIVFFKISDCTFQCVPSCSSEAFVECHVRFVGHAIGCCSVYDRFVEIENGIRSLRDVARDFQRVCVKTDAEKRLFSLDVLNQLFSCHN